ncbi:MAG: large conductance mechanosensitive channel protein MscL [Clostridiales bacterium]|nr:large conductance mechanosensitive channel protein MscL [Clostridiales bacterium]
MFEEFKKFITKGNVVDMAVGVIIGAAFTAIVTSFNKEVIMPIVNFFLASDGTAELVTVLKAVYTLDAEGNQILDMTNSIFINWGSFISKILDFLITAIILFTILKVVTSVGNLSSKVREKAKKKAEKLAKKLQKKGMSQEEAEAQAAAELAVAEEPAPAPAEPPKPTSEELLAEIRDLLVAQSAQQKSDAE